MVTFEDKKMNILYWLRITREENELSDRLGKKKDLQDEPH